MDLDQKFELIFTEFGDQVDLLIDLIDVFNEVNVLIENALINSKIQSPIRRQCLKRIVLFRKKIQILLNKKKNSLEKLKILVNDLPEDYKVLPVFVDFPKEIELKYNLIFLNLFGEESQNLSLERIIRNEFYNLNQVRHKLFIIISLLTETKEFIFNFKSNLEEQKGKIIFLKSKFENLRIDFKSILKKNKLESQNVIIIFDTNALIYMENQRIKLKKKAYDFIFPEESKIILFPKSFNESTIKNIFNKKSNVKMLVNYLNSLDISMKFDNLGNEVIRQKIINFWKIRNANVKNLSAFLRSLDLDILEFCDIMQDKGIQIQLFSKDRDIWNTVIELKNKGFFQNVNILDFNQDSKEVEFKAIA